MPIGSGVKYSNNVAKPTIIARAPNAIANLSNRVVSSAMPALHRMKHKLLLYFIAAELGNICKSAVQCTCQAIRTVIPNSATIAVPIRINVRERAEAEELSGNDCSNIWVISHMACKLQPANSGRPTQRRGLLAA